MGLGVAGLALSAIGTGAGMLGSLQQASAAQASAKYQSEVATTNQTIATQNAQYAAASGEEQAALQEQKTRAQTGAILAGQGSSGVDINSPTSTAVRTSASEVGALDAQTIRANAARQAYGFQTEATQYGNQKQADISQANNYAISGPINASAGLLSGAGSASQNYADVMGNASGMGTNQVYSSAIGPSYPGEPLGQ